MKKKKSLIAIVALLLVVAVGVTFAYFQSSAVFENVLWNSQNGWIKDCLVLNNGATVTVPMNIFGQGGGVTFEIDFETSNVDSSQRLIS